MNTTHLLSGIVSVSLLSAVSPAATLLQDDFESYPQQASPNSAFDTAWPIAVAATGSTSPTATAAITSFITAGTGTDTTNVVSFPANGSGNIGRRVRSFADTVPTPAAAVSFSFDFYDSLGAGERQYAEILANDSSGTAQQLISVGESNVALTGTPTPGGTVGTYSSSKYEARVAFGPTGGGAGYFNLQTTRTAGWHTFTTIIDGSKIDFYVDGTLDTSFTNSAAATGASSGYDQVRMSSGLSSAAGSASFDNFLVQTIATPEPASLTMLAAAGMILARRRRV